MKLKFKNIRYVYLEFLEIEEKLKVLINEFKNSKSAAKAIENFNKVYEYSDYFSTIFNLAYIRNSLDTNDEYYEKEIYRINKLFPKISEIFQEMRKATLESPFRRELEEK